MNLQQSLLLAVAGAVGLAVTYAVGDSIDGTNAWAAGLLTSFAFSALIWD